MALEQKKQFCDKKILSSIETEKFVFNGTGTDIFYINCILTEKIFQRNFTRPTRSIICQ
jgi:hypothetical protein